jgi:hypothetical protein
MQQLLQPDVSDTRTDTEVPTIKSSTLLQVLPTFVYAAGTSDLACMPAAGGYYKSVEDALKLHAQLGKASEVAQKAGGLASTAAAAPGGSRTLFVPGGNHLPCLTKA